MGLYRLEANSFRPLKTLEERTAYKLGSMARRGLQNLYASVRSRPAPPNSFKTVHLYNSTLQPHCWNYVLHLHPPIKAPFQAHIPFNFTVGNRELPTGSHLVRTSGIGRCRSRTCTRTSPRTLSERSQSLDRR